VTLANGKTATAKFSIKPEAGNQYRLKVNADGGLDAVAVK
jgi:hypothetical protein